MRRSTAISQVLLLLVFYVVPLLAETPATLPACCRRNGAHHCMMRDSTPADGAAFRNPVHCPYRFGAIILTHATKSFLGPEPATTPLPGAREILAPENSGGNSIQLAAGPDSRGPPALTL